jgi:RNA polymerase sigma-70 factor (ECF subfamily)
VEIGHEGRRDRGPEPIAPAGDDQRLRFQVLYETHYGDVYAFALRRLFGANEDAADVTAEIFATAWRRRDRVPAPPEDRLWLYGVARRVLFRHQRGAWRRARLLRRLGTERRLDDGLTDPWAPPATDRERVRAAIARLKPSDRDVLSLVLWEQLSHSEAAVVLGCSVNAVALRLHKARARLRRALDVDHQRRGNGHDHDS